MTRLCGVIAILLFTFVPAHSFDFHHSRPLLDSPVPISGWPFYIENITVGSPISDYGSHAGIKASVEDDYISDPEMFIPSDALLFSAHYAAYTNKSGQIDQFAVVLKEISKDGAFLFFPYDRSIEFMPFGFTESGNFQSLRATGHVFTVETDLFGYTLKIENQSDHPVSFSPQLIFQRDSDRKDESLNPFPIRAKYSLTLKSESNTAMVFVRNEGIWRALKTDFALESVQTSNWSKRAIISGNEIEIQPEGSKTLSWLVSFALSEQEAMQIISNADPSVLPEAWKKTKLQWDDFLGSLPNAHSDKSEYQSLAQLAATGLRMNDYAPRNAMLSNCSVPAKSHFTSFWGWDTPFQAMGAAWFDPQRSKQAIETIFSGPDDRVYLEMTDALEPRYSPALSQPPTAGWAMWNVFQKDGGKDTGWIARLYKKSKVYLDWWMTEKDVDGDGFSEFSYGLECGWDDNPRYHCNLPVSACIERIDYIDSVTLNSWLVLYYRSMESMARIVAPEQADDWLQKALDLGRLMEQDMWSEAMGAYFDLEFDGTDHRLHHVLTPAIAWPLFAGIARNPNRIKRVIEEHLLNEREFWGKEGQMPFPSVAFSDFGYDYDQDGYYWEGQIWLVTSYAIIQSLYQYGYETEAYIAAERTLDAIIQNDPGGIYETYDADTGLTGFSTNGRLFGAPGEPAAFLFGWSCAFVLELLHEGYQRQRFVMPEDTSFRGHIEMAQDLVSGLPYYQIDQWSEYELPEIDFRCAEDKPLLDECSSFLVRFDDPWKSLSGDSFLARFPMLWNASLSFESDEGVNFPIENYNAEKGVAFFATTHDFGTYIITMPAKDDSEGDENLEDDPPLDCCG